MLDSHKAYIRQCYKESNKEKGDGYSQRVRVWKDTLQALCDYVDSIAVPKGYPKAHYDYDLVYWGLCLGVRDGVDRSGGAFEGDSYDTGIRAWYHYIGCPYNRSLPWYKDPCSATIGWIEEVEKFFDADINAPSLTFSVTLPEGFCPNDKHSWKLIGEGRHGSNKGEELYECRNCSKTEWVR